MPIPASLASLKDKDIRFSEVIAKDEMKDFVFRALNVK